jgi:single-strand DNA-binding protein
MDINKVIVIGRLVRDAELKYTTAGQPVSKFSLAINEKKKSGDEWVDDVSYVDITLWGKQAENLHQYLTKGKQIAIDGKLRQERWTDRDSGQNRSKISVNALNVQLLGSGKDGGGNDGGGGSSRASYSPGKPAPAAASKPAAPAEAYPNDDGFADDIPF